MSNRAPAFLNKPNHSGTVVATSRGWVVEETGELLVSVKGLDKKISEHLGITIALNPPVLDEVVDPEAETKVPEKEDIKAILDNLSDAPKAVAEPEPQEAPKAPEAQPEVTKPRRGRPPKVRTETEQAAAK